MAVEPQPHDLEATSIIVPGQESCPSLPNTDVVQEGTAYYVPGDNTPLIEGAVTPLPGSDTTAFDGKKKEVSVTDATCNLPSEPSVEADRTGNNPPPEPGSATRNVHDRTRNELALPASIPPEIESATRNILDRTKQEQTPAASGSAKSPFTPTTRYRLKKFHAKGGMGEVWLAEDLSIGRAVALKKIRSGIKGMEESFVWEAQITGQLEHPGVVPVHELNTNEKGEPFYVMKFVHGKTLLTAITEFHDVSKPKLEPREVARLRLLQIFLNLCQTMAYAHSRGVIHRDIKPDNIMLGEYGETLILDWGLAKIVGEDERANSPDEAVHISDGSSSVDTIAGSIKGTPFYMAPESARGDVKAVDQQSDVFLLGGTLYHILANRRPRHARTLKEIIALAQQPSVPPRKIDPTIAKPLDAICMKALAVDKKDRYLSAAALADDMQRFLAGEPVSAYQESLPERIGRWCRRHRLALGRSAALLIFLGLTTFGLTKYRELDARRETAEREAEVLNQQKQARLDLHRYRRLAEETRYLAANSNSLAENAPVFQPHNVAARGQEALALTADWGLKLEAFPLAEERESLAKDLADLNLVLAQMLSEPDPQEAAAHEMLTRLEHAERLQGPTRGYYRLRQRALQALGQKDAADEASIKAQDPSIPMTAQDHFLIGEKYRTVNLPAQEQDQGWKPDRASLENAAEQYRLALQQSPEHFWSYFRLGNCYYNLGRNLEAIQSFSTCIALRPDSPFGYSLRGLSLALQKRFNESEADLNQAVRLDPNFQPARLNRGILAWLRNDDREALAQFGAVSAPNVKPRLMQGTFAKAQLLAERGKLDEALDQVKQVLAEDLPIRTAYLLRAQLYFALEKDAEGLQDLDAFFGYGKRDYDPENATSYAKRGHRLRSIILDLPTKSRGGRLRLAEQQLRQASETARPEVFDDLGMVCEYLGKNQSAIDAYTKALELAPKDSKILVKRAWAYEKLQPPDLDQAETDFKQATQLDGENAEIHTGLGYIKACRKDEAAARRAAQRALLYGAGDYLILHNVACIYAKLADLEPMRVVEFEDLALDHLQRAMNLWQRERSKPNLIEAIERESAFSASLRARPEFRQLLDKRQAVAPGPP